MVVKMQYIGVTEGFLRCILILSFKYYQTKISKSLYNLRTQMDGDDDVETIICTHVMNITNAVIIEWKSDNLHSLFTQTVRPFTAFHETWRNTTDVFVCELHVRVCCVVRFYDYFLVMVVDVIKVD